MPENVLATRIAECETPLGTLGLWYQPFALAPDRHFTEIRLGGSLLMSSGTNFSEIALATECLSELGDHRGLRVLVGGLGLGYTANAAIQDDRVAEVTVIEFLPEIIAWHRQGLLPLGSRLVNEPRCRIVEGDFFGLIGAGGHLKRDLAGEDGASPPGETVELGRYDAILIDIDDSPNQPLHKAHRGFYEPAGLRKIADFLEPGGVFGLWSFDAESGQEFESTLNQMFAEVRLHEVPHHDETTGRDETHLLFVAKSPLA